MNSSSLPDGLYENVLSRGLRRRLQAVTDRETTTQKTDDADAPDVLTRHISDALRSRLREVKPEERVRLIESIADLLHDDNLRYEQPLEQLTSLVPPASVGAKRIDPTRRPATPLSDAALLTNAPGEPGMAAELRAELASADRVDLLCAFVMWPGIRLLQQEMAQLAARGVPFRVITTTYLGGTQRAALDRLARDYGAEIRVQYEARRTRLHAKAWLFHRDSGLDTAYVGSSNLTNAALTDGIEWNVRLSRVGTPALLDKFIATFDSYWACDNFAPYHPEVDADRLDEALAVAGRRDSASAPLTLSGLDVKPYPYQQAILDALTAEREDHDRHRNLVVAATGTGKTVMAALDYRRLAHAVGRRPRLLFVAHRREILEQSLRTYREVLGDGSFGELWVGEHRPRSGEHVFASIQGLARGIDSIPPELFEVVVVDEFHHAEARTYTTLLNHLRPVELLGLTATPERADGTDVRVTWFHGRSAAELRLWDAIANQMLAPFHYFGIHDNTDLDTISWRRGRYDERALSDLYTGNHARVRLVLKAIEDKVTDPRRMRALGFCVGIEHAQFMATCFTQAGLPARAVHGGTPAHERKATLDALRAGEITAVFAADLLNEGIDIPEVDTVLFLRPTESSAIFLQQLGRGLRLHPSKEVLTCLDFVGHQHAGFRFDARFRALTGANRKDLREQVEQGFPTLPAGCGIVLDRYTQDQVLRSIKNHLSLRWKQMVTELRAHPTHDLHTFLDHSGATLPDLLRGSGKDAKYWTRLQREAGLVNESASAAERCLSRRLRAFAHVDDRPRRDAYASILADPRLATGNPYEAMLFFSLWPSGQDDDGQPFVSMDAAWQQLSAEPLLREELRMLIDIAFDSSRVSPQSVARPGLTGLPLRIHARYQREEILGALGYAHLGRAANSFREGVLRVDMGENTIDALFVTLKKSEAHFSPSTRYRDYALSPTLFHWESQSTTTLTSPTGQRYVNGGSTVLLFVREEKTGELGTSPFTFLGPATYVSHQGEKPIAITWRLDVPMPADLYTAAAVAAS